MNPRCVTWLSWACGTAPNLARRKRLRQAKAHWLPREAYTLEPLLARRLAPHSADQRWDNPAFDVRYCSLIEGRLCRKQKACLRLVMTPSWAPLLKARIALPCAQFNNPTSLLTSSSDICHHACASEAANMA